MNSVSWVVLFYMLSVSNWVKLHLLLHCPAAAEFLWFHLAVGQQEVDSFSHAHQVHLTGNGTDPVKPTRSEPGVVNVTKASLRCEAGRRAATDPAWGRPERTGPAGRTGRLSADPGPARTTSPAGRASPGTPRRRRRPGCRAAAPHAAGCGDAAAAPAPAASRLSRRHTPDPGRSPPTPDHGTPGDRENWRVTMTTHMMHREELPWQRTWCTALHHVSRWLWTHSSTKSKFTAKFLL